MSVTLDRPSGRALDELRAITFERNFTCHAEGSVSRKSPAQSPVFTGVTGGWETWRLGVMKKNIREAFT